MTTAAEPSFAARPSWGAGRVLAIVFGSLLGLLALALIAAGGFLLWADRTQRDAQGYLMTGAERLSTPTYALTSEGVDVRGEGPDWLFRQNRLGMIRLRVEPAGATPVFVGIGPERAVDEYLARIAHDELNDLGFAPFSVDYLRRAGRAPARMPESAGVWVASVKGAGTQTLDWRVEKGRWSVVVMNADGSKGLAVDAAVGAKLGFLLWLAIGLLAGGVVLVVGSIAAVALALVHRPGERGGGGAMSSAATPVPAQAAAVPYPVRVDARLDEPLSRWLWLVKWILAIPHFIVLAFLWIAFVVLTVYAWFAILFTGRYPRSIFDFNVGVLRWTWRVEYYAYAGLGTDKYPPFSLGPEPDYPATLDIPYPERLSRGLVLVKSWLLAIPHLLVVAIFTGTWIGWTFANGDRVTAPGLIMLLAVIGAVIMAFRSSYPPEIFRFVLGMNRWVFRVIAYVALMRDEYPPFRLEP